jgi:hypothetical protein
MSSLRLGDLTPDFEQDSSIGRRHFREWLSKRWAVLLSHPADFMAVCTAKLGRNLILIAATIIVAHTAVADTGGYTATLAQALTQKKEIIVNGNLFRCNGSTCILVSVPQDADSVHGCRALRREVGTLTAYVAEGKPFDADKLAKCNAHS